MDAQGTRLERCGKMLRSREYTDIVKVWEGELPMHIITNSHTDYYSQHFYPFVSFWIIIGLGLLSRKLTAHKYAEIWMLSSVELFLSLRIIHFVSLIFCTRSKQLERFFIITDIPGKLSVPWINKFVRHLEWNAFFRV